MGFAHSYNNYGDGLARKRRRHFFIKIFLILAILIGLAFSTAYLMFFSKVMHIDEVVIRGVKTLKTEEILAIIESEINTEFFELFPLKLQKNILLFDKDIPKEKILAQFSVIQQLNIKKDYPHKIVIDIEERSAVGTWCFGPHEDKAEECQYFDENGFLWGKALKSSGPLLLIVEDSRLFSEKIPDKLENELIKAIINITTEFDKLSLKIKKIELPRELINDLKVYTLKNYYILFNIESNLAEQLDSFRIFLDEKGSDLEVEYIDARIAGRIYFK